MRMKKLWTALLSFWMLLLALWAALCWNHGAAWAAPSLRACPYSPAEKLPLKADSFSLQVPCLDQRDGFPTGCESVSAVMALRYFGADVTVDQFVDGFLPLGTAPYVNSQGEYVGCDPRESFPGDPRSENGWGCYAPVIAAALEKYLTADPYLGLTVREEEGTPLETLCSEYVARGAPVLLWATIGMEPPTPTASFRIEGSDEVFTWLYPLHCVVLTGWDETSYFCNDPMEGKTVAYPKEEVERAYQGLGSQSVVLLPQDF